jgi:hypothetical protein
VHGAPAILLERVEEDTYRLQDVGISLGNLPWTTEALTLV